MKQKNFYAFSPSFLGKMINKNLMTNGCQGALYSQVTSKKLCEETLGMGIKQVTRWVSWTIIKMKTGKFYKSNIEINVLSSTHSSMKWG